jgi:hypothetical protein
MRGANKNDAEERLAVVLSNDQSHELAPVGFCLEKDLETREAEIRLPATTSDEIQKISRLEKLSKTGDAHADAPICGVLLSPLSSSGIHLSKNEVGDSRSYSRERGSETQAKMVQDRTLMTGIQSRLSYCGHQVLCKPGRFLADSSVPVPVPARLTD